MKKVSRLLASCVFGQRPRSSDLNTGGQESRKYLDETRDGVAATNGLSELR